MTNDPFPGPVISIVTSGATNNHTFAVPFNPNPSPTGLWLFGHLVKLYADAGTNVTLKVPTDVCFLNVSGLLVNTP